MKLTNFTEDYLFLLEQEHQFRIQQTVRAIYIIAEEFDIEYDITTEKRKHIWITTLRGSFVYPYDKIQKNEQSSFDPKLLALIKEMLSSSAL